MKNKNCRQSALLSIVILFLEYLLIRYVLFDLHSMKDWPTVLFVSCFVLIAICFFIKKTIAPHIISISYVIGFVLGYIFQSSEIDAGGGSTNNLWLIWTITIFVFIFIAIITELFALKKTKR